jgi:hypothetical protein
VYKPGIGFEKTANAVLNDPIMPLATWERIYGSKSFGVKTASLSKVAAEQSKFILSHCTIMASVACEAEPYDYLIKDVSSLFVNSNWDAWENDVLRKSYRSFIGGFNFVEHLQNSKENKGHILDAVLRKVYITPEVFIYYVDILVATDLAHEELVSDIRSGKTRFLSMGCVTDLITCSFCGARVTDSDNFCMHLYTAKGTYLADEDGIPRIVAELCGHKTLPNGGVKFVEASWVGTPAFLGAAKRNIISDSWNGPKTPFTHLAAGQGLRKAASAVQEPMNLRDARLMADFRRQLR